MCNFLPLQVNPGAVSTNSTSLGTPRSLTELRNSSHDESLTVNSLSEDIVLNVPQTTIRWKKILVVRRYREYERTEVEHVVVTMEFKPVLIRRRITHTIRSHVGRRY